MSCICPMVQSKVQTSARPKCWAGTFCHFLSDAPYRLLIRHSSYILPVLLRFLHTLNNFVIMTLVFFFFFFYTFPPIKLFLNQPQWAFKMANLFTSAGKHVKQFCPVSQLWSAAGWWQLQKRTEHLSLYHQMHFIVKVSLRLCNVLRKSEPKFLHNHILGYILVKTRWLHFVLIHKTLQWKSGSSVSHDASPDEDISKSYSITPTHKTNCSTVPS